MNIFLSSNLKALRKEKKISQDELARSLDVSRNKISSYEGKGIEPKLSLLLKLSLFFEVSVDDLVTTQLTSENIQSARMAYRSSIAKIEPSSSQTSVTSAAQAHLDPELVNLFVANNERSYKMMDGFRSFYRLKSRGQAENPDVSNLMIILNHVLEVNKTFVHNLQNQLLNA